MEDGRSVLRILPEKHGAVRIPRLRVEPRDGEELPPSEVHTECTQAMRSLWCCAGSIRRVSPQVFAIVAVFRDGEMGSRAASCGPGSRCRVGL